MRLFSNQKNGALADVIRCDEASYLIWKWRPEGATFGRENSIRWGSSLRVKDGEAAVFVYNQKNGEYQDVIVGPYDGTLMTENLPVIAKIIGFAYAGGSPFQAEIYYINLAQIIQSKFAVPYFDVYDPRFADFGLPVAVRGTITFKIADIYDFMKLHRLHDFDIDAFQNQIRDVVRRYVKDTVANAPAAHNIPVVQLESKIAQINDAVEYDLRERLHEDFGVEVSGIDIGTIEIDKTSDGYRQLMAVTKDLTTATLQAQTAANIKNYEETLRIQREEGQYAQHKQTQTANFAAFKMEKQAEVGVAAANALGQMGVHGEGEVSLGGEGTGFSPAAMVAGMAVGGAVGQNLAGMMNGMMPGASPVSHITAVPPPIPTTTYHIAIDGKATGPYDLPSLKQMAMSGLITINTLAWKEGMGNWLAMSGIPELAELFSDVPPIP